MHISGLSFDPKKYQKNRLDTEQAVFLTLEMTVLNPILLVTNWLLWIGIDSAQGLVFSGN